MSTEPARRRGVQIAPAGWHRHGLGQIEMDACRARTSGWSAQEDQEMRVIYPKLDPRPAVTSPPNAARRMAELPRRFETISGTGLFVWSRTRDRTMKERLVQAE
jgi:hypothetical protein